MRAVPPAAAQPASPPSLGEPPQAESSSEELPQMVGISEGKDKQSFTAFFIRVVFLHKDVFLGHTLSAFLYLELAIVVGLLIEKKDGGWLHL